MWFKWQFIFWLALSTSDLFLGCIIYENNLHYMMRGSHSTEKKVFA